MSLNFLEKINLSRMKIQQADKVPLLLYRTWLKHQKKRVLWEALKDIISQFTTTEVANKIDNPISTVKFFYQ